MKKSKAIRRIEAISKFIFVVSLISISIGILRSGLGILRVAEGIGLNASRAEISEDIKMIAEGLVLIVHYFFVARFVVTALSENVPLTHEAAKEMRILGIETLVLPILVEVFGIIVSGSLNLLTELIELEIYELMLGVFIIQTSYVIDYATDKIVAGHKHHLINEKLQEKYPDIYEEIKNELDQ